MENRDSDVGLPLSDLEVGEQLLAWSATPVPELLVVVCGCAGSLFPWTQSCKNKIGVQCLQAVQRRTAQARWADLHSRDPRRW